MQINDFHVELPQIVGDGTEFFLQATPPENIACAAHVHKAVELLYVKSGSYSLLLDGVEYEIGEGDLVLFCSNAIHHVFTKNLPRNEYYVIKISPAFFLQFSTQEEGAEYVMRFAVNRKGSKCIWTKEELEGTPLFSALQSLIGEHEGKKYASGVATKLKIMELLVEILRSDSPADEKTPHNQTAALIYNTMVFVRNHYAEDMDERELARSLGMSYSYFSRSFRRVTGMTFKQYLNRMRVNQAEKLLCRGGISVSEAATRCGYNSISYFISVYKSITGKTPYQSLQQTVSRQEKQ
ncbi:MAG: helix-turn-helix transcriptional regulator [Clostridia bacterium]|nr:helix-turn-helix transcriptional regulator [Clostridia bacterium]